MRRSVLRLVRSAVITIAALTAMRDHPEAIRAAVLDSVVPFEVDFFATLTANGLRAFEALDAASSASASKNGGCRIAAGKTISFMPGL